MLLFKKTIKNVIEVEEQFASTTIEAMAKAFGPQIRLQ